MAELAKAAHAGGEEDAAWTHKSVTTFWFVLVQLCIIIIIIFFYSPLRPEGK